MSDAEAVDASRRTWPRPVVALMTITSMVVLASELQLCLQESKPVTALAYVDLVAIILLIILWFDRATSWQIILFTFLALDIAWILTLTYVSSRMQVLTLILQLIALGFVSSCAIADIATQRADC